MNINLRLTLHGSALALLLAGAVAAAACSPAASTGGKTGGGGTTGAGGRTSSGGGGSTSTTGAGGAVTTGAGGTVVTTGAGGAGGAAAVKLCATKTVVANPVFLNFENYNGMDAAANYVTAFGGTAVNMGNAYTGPYMYGDNSATPVLGMKGGHPPSNWAVNETVTNATTWGMGGGFWMGCADASAFRGISFWARGQRTSTPASATPATFSFSVVMESTVMPDATNPAGGGTCAGTTATCTPATKADIPLAPDWTQVQILWADFTPGMSGTTAVTPNGNNITGMQWNVGLEYVLAPGATDPVAGPYVAVPANLSLDIDDVSFIQ